MARSNDPLNREEIGVVARIPTVRVQAPVTNQALRLAQGISRVSPEAEVALQGIAERRAEQERARAQKDAIEASGAKLADAVREGKLKATQNPWYVEAYNREAAAIRAQDNLQSLQVEANSWDERDDPQAFQSRWRSEVGALAEEYEGPEQIAGFKAAEAAATSQTLQQNVARNAARIQTERASNLALLSTDALGEAVSLKGGFVTGADAMEALAPSRQQWFETGGDEAGWRNILLSSFQTLARKLGEQGADPNIVRELAQDPALLGGEEGGSSLYDLPDFAEKLENTLFRANQSSFLAPLRAHQRRTAERQARGSEGSDFLIETFGIGVITGEVTREQMIDTLTEQNYTVQEIQEALQFRSQGLRTSVSLSNAQIAARGQNPENAIEMMELEVEGRKNGWSEAYEDRVADGILRGDYTKDDAVRMVAASQSRTQQLKSEARANRAEARAIAGRGSTPGSGVRSASSLKVKMADYARLYYGNVSSITGRTPPIEVQEEILGQITEQTRRYLNLNPGQYEQAAEVGRLYMLQKMRETEEAFGVRDVPREKAEGRN